MCGFTQRREHKRSCIVSSSRKRYMELKGDWIGLEINLSSKPAAFKISEEMKPFHITCSAAESLPLSCEGIRNQLTQHGNDSTLPPGPLSQYPKSLRGTHDDLH